eukprot:11655703-Alexandrium_andersonii.AAC.1
MAKGGGSRGTTARAAGTGGARQGTRAPLQYRRWGGRHCKGGSSTRPPARYTTQHLRAGAAAAAEAAAARSKRAH